MIFTSKEDQRKKSL